MKTESPLNHIFRNQIQEKSLEILSSINSSVNELSESVKEKVDDAEI